MKKSFFGLMVCVLMLAVTGAWAQNNQTIPTNKKIEPELIKALQVQGQADFILHFAQQADLSPAYGMDWESRGAFVYEALRKTADASQEKAKKLLRSNGFEYVSFFNGNLLYVRGGSASLAQSLAGMFEVTAVTAPKTYTIVPPVIDKSMDARIQATSNLAWGIIDTGADQFWQSYGSGEGIVIAGIDTGVEWDHPALFGAFKCGSNPADPACWSDPSDICGAGGACDNNGHGTHTMGTMVGDNDTSLEWRSGMAPGATWIACKGCEGDSCSDFALNSCADWIIAPNDNPGNRPHVVNNSWGGGSGDDWYLAKVNAWRAAGIFPAFSAGNDGPSCNTLGSPGDYQESFATAAHDSSGDIASFSSRGPSAFGDTPYTKPNISAPGVSICSSVPGDGWSCGYSGTSMASPHTAGAVALLWACNPDLVGNIDGTIQVLQSTADTAPAGDCGAPTSGDGNYTYGYGYLDVLAAGNQYCGPVGTLQGQVLYAVDSTPIEGARVSAMGPLSREVLTNASGLYSMILPEGTYDVTVSNFGSLPESATGVEVIENATTTQDFSLDEAPFSTVSGRVEDDATGWPLYASIAVAGRPGDPVWTDPVTGEYSVELPQGSSYDFTVSAFVEGYEPVERSVGPVTGNRAEDFYLEADLEVCSAPGYLNAVYLQDFESDNGGYTPSDTPSDLWQWGAPVTWPSTCASGEKCWGTNLTGDYPNSASSDLTSPVIDLSGVAGPLNVSWQQALYMESQAWDQAYAEVSINSGSWQVMWQHEASNYVQDSWAKKTYDISSAAGGTVQFRFRITTDSSMVYSGYYIDLVQIGTCGTPTGGIVVGNVFDANTAVGLTGALVEGDAGQTAITQATPSDPAVYDGFYTLYSEAGDHTFEASLAGYGEVQHAVSVVSGTAVWRDFDLLTGLLVADPTALSVTVAMGWTATVPLTLSNEGDLPVDFDIGESPVAQPAGVSIPRFTESLPVSTVATSIDRAPERPSNVSGHAVYPGVLAGAPAFAMDVILGNLVNIPDTNAPGTWSVIANKPGSKYFAGDFINGDFSTLYVIDYDLNQLHALDTATGSHQVIGSCEPLAGEYWAGMTGGVNGVMYASSTDSSRSTLYTVDLATGAANVIGEITNAPAIIDIAMSTDQVIYGVDIDLDSLILIDPQTAAGTVIGSLGFDANYAQGMDFEEESGVLYLAAYNMSSFSGELRVADLNTGATALIGAFPDGTEVDAFAFATGGGDVPWLDENPVSGTLAPGASQVIDVLFNAGDDSITGVGLYEAKLHVMNSSMYGTIDIPVEMNVIEPECEQDADCYDGIFCNGEESCENGSCVSGPEPCYEDEICNETNMTCDPLCTLRIKRNPIPIYRLTRSVTKMLVIRGDDGFDPSGEVTVEAPLQVVRTRPLARYGVVLVWVRIPAFDHAGDGSYTVRVGNCTTDLETNYPLL